MKRSLAVAFAAACSCVVAGAAAQTLAPMDQQVIAKLHQANQMEMEVGKLAQQKGANADVKRYGQLLIGDHQKGDQLVTQLAKRKGLDSIPEPKPETPADKEEMQKQQMMMQQLQQADGPQFDAAFSKAMVEAHEKAVAMVTDASGQVSDTDLRKTLKKLVPILKQHLEIAQRLSGSTSTTSTRR